MRKYQPRQCSNHNAVLSVYDSGTCLIKVENGQPMQIYTNQLYEYQSQILLGSLSSTSIILSFSNLKNKSGHRG